MVDQQKGAIDKPEIGLFELCATTLGKTQSRAFAVSADTDQELVGASETMEALRDDLDGRYNIVEEPEILNRIVQLWGHSKGTIVRIVQAFFVSTGASVVQVIAHSADKRQPPQIFWEVVQSNGRLVVGSPKNLADATSIALTLSDSEDAEAVPDSTDSELTGSETADLSTLPPSSPGPKRSFP